MTEGTGFGRKVQVTEISSSVRVVNWALRFWQARGKDESLIVAPRALRLVESDAVVSYVRSTTQSGS